MLVRLLLIAKAMMGFVMLKRLLPNLGGVSIIATEQYYTMATCR